MNLFYLENIDEDFCVLPEDESKHCVKVLRFTEGERLSLIDGKGSWYDAELIDAHPKRCKLKIINIIRDYGKRDFSLHLAVAPTKNMERLEWMLEKCTEMGVDEISFILTDHSERKVVKMERIHKIVVSAMKQSYKAYLPKLNPIISFDKFIELQKEGEYHFIAHCHNAEKYRIDEVYKAGRNVLVMIGPEGDFSEREVMLARKNGFKELTLSTSRLRTETAGIVACHSVNLINKV